MTGVFDHPWLGALFGDEEVARLWSADAQLDHYRAFETALVNALASADLVTAAQAEAAKEAINNAKLDMAALAKGTAKDGLPIPSFVRQLRAAAGDGAAAVHTGATSQDVLDTAVAMTLLRVCDVLMQRLSDLAEALATLSVQFGANHLMARTRMQAALPITVAQRIDSWRGPLDDHTAALKDLRSHVGRLQLGGPVGSREGFGDHANAIAAQMADALGLDDAKVWHADRNSIVAFGSRLSQITGTLGKMGQDIALMAQQGLEEIKLQSGGGSSAMAHKSNPVLAELLVTLARANSVQVAGLHHEH